MDRKSWLWRRKSSEKSPGGETESTGSVSSHSERFFDDQVYAVHSAQSPEVISKVALNANDEEDVSESVKSLKDTLRSALLDIAAKEDLVKQHSKVAEEAVNGWEKAENEMLALKTKLEASNQKNSALEDHVGHLDQALKECVRQLRQAREDKEQKIQEAVSNKDSSNLALENQLDDLRERLRIAEAETADSETEILRLRTELRSHALERDLSVRSAEAASKQHLEGMRKIAKLESECRRLNALARKASSQQTDHDLLKKRHEPPSMIHAVPLSALPEIDTMDDFLEMERLAAATSVRECDSEASLEELEKKFEESERERSILEKKLEGSERELSELEKKLVESEKVRSELEKKSMESEREQSELEKNLRRRLFEAEERAEGSRGERDTKLRAFEGEIGLLRREIGSLQGQIRKERGVSKDISVKCRKLEEELSSVRLEAEKRKEAELRRIENTKLNEKFKQEKELSLAAQKFAECQKTIASLGQQLKSLSTIEDFMMETEKQTSIPCL